MWPGLFLSHLQRSTFELLIHLYQPFAGFATNKLRHAPVSALANLLRGPIKDDLWLLTFQPGKTELESEPGAGARFAMYLPEAREHRADRRTEEVAEVVRGDETVLIIDDEERVRNT